MNYSKSAFVIVPAYNESARIKTVLEEIVSHGFRVIAVDDGSDDNTWEAMRTPGVTRLRHPINRGQGAALQTGITFALSKGADFIVTFDADGQHSASDIHQILNPIMRGECDIVLGSRFLGNAPNLPLTRMIALKLGIIFTGIVSGFWLSDTHNGLRAFTSEAARQLDLQLDRMAHASELLHWIRRSGFRYCEIPVTINYNSDTLKKGQPTSGAFAVACRFLFSLVKQ